MNARFSELCPANYLQLSSRQDFEKNLSLQFPQAGKCEEDIFLGFFFDGTNNNKYRDHPTVSQLELCKMSLLARMASLRWFHFMVPNSRVVA
ncbi:MULTISPECIES: hypothetical protein [Herbaspirillum]|uniref:hypothetical protein n=1 Tax=Herbaspirillum TaxID=963 RepID=UPI0009FDAB2D|nr:MULTISPECIES: hypothetical protein [Herbaspirillum]